MPLDHSKANSIIRLLLCKSSSIQSIICYSFILVLAFVVYFTATLAFQTCPVYSQVNIASVSTLLIKDPKKIAILITGTGKYAQLAMELIDSGRDNFCRRIKEECRSVTYILFTDVDKEQLVPLNYEKHLKDIIFIKKKREGWPHDSMKRFHNYLNEKETLEKFDFIISMDADLRFIDRVELSEIYSDLTAVLHPNYLKTVRWKLPFERLHPESKAYVSKMANCRYFTAAIWAGEQEHFIRALRTLVWQLDSDAERLGANFTAVWHDESHLNRYFVDNHPTRILLPSYYYPEDAKNFPETYSPIYHLPKKILALKKNYKIMRHSS